MELFRYLGIVCDFVVTIYDGTGIWSRVGISCGLTKSGHSVLREWRYNGH